MARAELTSILTSYSGRNGNMVFYTVGKRVYARRYVKPYNPESEAQQSQRSLFAEAMAAWKMLSADEKYPFRKKAKKLPMHAHNLFIKDYIKTRRQELKEVTESDIVSADSPVQNSIIKNKQSRTSSEASLYPRCTTFVTPLIQPLSSS